MAELAHAAGGKTMSTIVPEPETEQSASEILLVVVDGGNTEGEGAPVPASASTSMGEATTNIVVEPTKEPGMFKERQRATGFIEAREIKIDDDGVSTTPLSKEERAELEQLRAEKAARERRELERLRAEHRRAKRRAQRRAELRAERAAALAETQAYAESMDPSLDSSGRRNVSTHTDTTEDEQSSKGMPAAQRTVLVCNGVVAALVLCMSVMGI